MATPTFNILATRPPPLFERVVPDGAARNSLLLAASTALIGRCCLVMVEPSGRVNFERKQGEGKLDVRLRAGRAHSNRAAPAARP
jgi:hypothetical protein